MFDKMLKAAGFDPADIKKQVDDAADNFNKVIEHFDARLDFVQKQNDEIISLLKNNA